MKKNLLSLSFIFACFIFSYQFIDLSLAIFFQNNTYLLSLAQIFTKLGSGLVIFIVLCLMIIMAHFQGNKLLIKQIFFILAMFALIGTINSIAKIILARARPIEYFEHAVYGFQLFRLGHHYASFPSGHTMAIVSVLAGFSNVWPKHKIFFMSSAALISFCRIIVGAHYFSDVWIGYLFSWYLVLFFTSTNSYNPLCNLCPRPI